MSQTTQELTVTPIGYSADSASAIQFPVVNASNTSLDMSTSHKSTNASAHERIHTPEGGAPNAHSAPDTNATIAGNPSKGALAPIQKHKIKPGADILTFLRKLQDGGY